MRKPGVSAPQFFHLDGWNGWRFAKEPAPELLRENGAITLAPGSLPDPGNELPLDPRLAGLAFDAAGRPISLAEDAFPVAATDLSYSRHGRIFIALPDQHRV